MRILRVAQKCYPDVTGGGPYHVHALSRDQAAMGHEVTVLTVRDDPTLPHVESREGYTVVRFDDWCRPLGNALSPGIGTYLLSAHEFDVIHAHSHLYFSTNLAAFVRALGAIPAVSRPPLAITNHGLYSQTAPEWVFDWYLRTLGRMTLNRADTVFCYTDADATRLREVGVSAPVTVVPNGIDTGRFSPAGSETALFGDPAVLFVGRLVEGKHPEDAIAAVKQLRERYPDAGLSLCGEGSLRPALEAQAGPETVFLGHQPYDEMPALYRGADALVLPSRAEGTPRTVLEALACGTPAACSDLPHLRSSFGDSVRYFPVGDVEAIATALSNLVADGVSQAQAEMAVTDWAETVAKTTTCLETL